MTVASLGFAVDSSAAKRASIDLDALVSASQRAEKAEQGVGRASREAQSGIRSLATAVKSLTEAESRMGAGFAQKRAQDIAAYGAELDRLRAKFNPIFAASKQYETSLNELNRAHRVGAISTREYEDALERLNLEFASVQAGARGASVALDSMRLNMGQTRMMSRQLMFQMVDIGQSIPLAFQSPAFALQNLGFQMAQIGQLYAGQGGMKAALKDSVSMVGRFAARMGPAIAVTAGLGGAFLGLAHEINETASVQVTATDTFVATLTLIRDGIMDVLRPAIEAIAPFFAQAWEIVVAGVKNTGNFIINTFRLAFEGVSTLWSSFPDIIQGAVVGAVNAVIRGVNGMIQTAAMAINAVIRLANKIPGVEIGEVGTGPVLGEFENAAAGRVAEAMAGLQARAEEINASDPMGDIFNAISERAQERARRRQAGAAGAGGRAGGRGASEAEKQAREMERLRQAYDGIVASGEEFIAHQQMEQQALGMTEEAANRMRIEHELFNRALQAGIELTPQQAEELRRLAGEMAGAEERTATMTERFREMEERIAFANETATGFFTSFRDQLIEGASIWDALKSAATRALDAIMQKMDEMMQKQGGLFGGGSGGGGGGIFGSILNGVLGIGSAAFGGFGAGSFQTAGGFGAQNIAVASSAANAAGGGLFTPSGSVALPSFHTGGEFEVGGRGGIDQNLVSFWASRGERVRVTPANDRTAPEGRIVVNGGMHFPNVRDRDTAREAAGSMKRRLTELTRKGAGYT